MQICVICGYFCPLKSLLIILYVVCFGCYVLYTRHPDFFDGERAPGMIHWMHDSTEKRTIPKAIFRYNLTTYAVDARYLGREWKEGDKVEVIYEKEDASKGAVYALWGYWIRWQELIGSVISLVLLFQVAVSITRNPTPEAVMDQIEVKEEKKRRYKD